MLLLHLSPRFASKLPQIKTTQGAQLFPCAHSSRLARFNQLLEERFDVMALGKALEEAWWNRGMERVLFLNVCFSAVQVMLAPGVHPLKRKPVPVQANLALALIET